MKPIISKKILYTCSIVMHYLLSKLLIFQMMFEVLFLLFIVFAQFIMILLIATKSLLSLILLVAFSIVFRSTLIEYAIYVFDLFFNSINNILNMIGNKLLTFIPTLAIPDDLARIRDFEFKEYTYLTSITIPNSVTSIGNCAFYGCISLTSIIIPNSVTSIGYNAFENCPALKITASKEVAILVRDSGFPENRIFTPNENNIRNIIPEEGLKLYDQTITKQDILQLDDIQQVYIYSWLVLKDKAIFNKGVSEILVKDKIKQNYVILKNLQFTPLQIKMSLYLTLKDLMSFNVLSKSRKNLGNLSLLS